jgi:hypothetical protein
MYNLMQLIWNNNGNSRAIIWLRRTALAIIVLVGAYAIINVVAFFVSSFVHGLTSFAKNSIDSVSYSLKEGDRVETITRLCLWLLVILFLTKVLVKK